eukprot:PhF_6_TR8854/c0_g1_i1/m.14024
MDPTVCKGTLFTCRGAVTSQICDMWKQSVNKEQTAAAQWASKARKKDAGEDKKQKSSQSPSRQNQHAQNVDELEKQIKQLKQATASGSFTSSSKEIGARLKNYVQQPLDSAMTEHGHKPVITSSFYRTNGVF